MIDSKTLGKLKKSMSNAMNELNYYSSKDFNTHFDNDFSKFAQFLSNFLSDNDINTPYHVKYNIKQLTALSLFSNDLMDEINMTINKIINREAVHAYKADEFDNAKNKIIALSIARYENNLICQGSATFSQLDKAMDFVKTYEEFDTDMIELLSIYDTKIKPLFTKENNQ